MRIARKMLISTLGAVVLLLTGSIVTLPTGAVEPVGLDLSTTQAVDQYLLSQGVDPAEAVFQEGLLNYAGPLCPGLGWNCVDTTKPVVQSALAGGTNLFDCPLGQKDCFVVQRESASEPAIALAGGFLLGVAQAAPGGVNNIAHCNQNDKGDAVVETCTGANFTQTNSSGKNTALASMVINQNSTSDTVNQSGSQTAKVNQTNGSGSNLAKIVQRISQKAESNSNNSISQSQQADQLAEILQSTTTGENSATVLQTQSQSLKAKSDASIDQGQNAESTAPNAAADIEQNSDSGPQNVLLNQSIDQSGNATSSPGPVTQAQGSQGGGITGEIHQDSTGVSTFDADESETQTLNAVTIGPLTQTQDGPQICCLVFTQVSNPGNSLTIDQSSVQSAQEAQQNTFLEASYNTSGNGQANQSACQQGTCETNSVSGGGTQSATLACSSSSGEGEPFQSCGNVD